MKYATSQHALVLRGAFGTPILGEEAVVGVERAMVSCRLSFVKVVLVGRNLPSNVYYAQINRGSVTFEQNLARMGLTDVSQILTRSERAVWLSYAKEVVSISSAV